MKPNPFLRMSQDRILQIETLVYKRAQNNKDGQRWGVMYIIHIGSSPAAFPMCLPVAIFIRELPTSGD